MAGQVSKEELGTVLMQAQKNLRSQRYRLLQLRRRLEQLSTGDGDQWRTHHRGEQGRSPLISQRGVGYPSIVRPLPLFSVNRSDPMYAGVPAEEEESQTGVDYWAKVRDKIKKLATDLFKVYFIGIEYGSRTLGTCLMLAAKAGARLAVNLAFAVMPDEQLHDALLTQRLPARPTTQTEAFSRVEATLSAVKVAQDDHIPRCIEHLVGERPPTVVAAYRGLGKTDTSEPAAATVVDLDKVRDYLDRACTLLDLAVVVISRFLDPKKVTSLSEFTDKRAYISEDDGPYPSSD